MLVSVPWPDPLAPSYDFRVISASATDVIAYDESDRNPARWRKASDGWRVAIAEDATADDESGPHTRLWKPVPITQYAPPPKWSPLFADPATLGCLLALVREANPGCHTEPYGPGEPADDDMRLHWWAVHKSNGCLLSTGPTEAAALVAALKGAP